MNVSVVIGGLGFIGSNLVRSLLEEKRFVFVVDNFSRGKPTNLGALIESAMLKIVCADVSDRLSVLDVFEHAISMGTVTEVWHLAANSDIPAGGEDSDVDFKDTFLTTFEVLRAMQRYQIKNLHFASSSAIYGDLGQVLHESSGPLLPISNYGAMKLASEAQASAATETFLDRLNIFRFPNVVGVPATHGVIVDFIKKLITDKNTLNVLGDGSQQKAYLHVSDLLHAMKVVRSRPIFGKKAEVVNIGPVDEGVTVKWIAEQVVKRINPKAFIQFGIGSKGWPGDVPRFSYSTDRLQSYGWRPNLTSAEAVSRAIDEIALQEGF